jgi:hypothetical protein
MRNRPNILLVHGAWGDSSHWRHVIPLLHEKDTGPSQCKTLLPRFPTPLIERAN